MNDRLPVTYYEELERRLRALDELVSELVVDRLGWYREYLDAGEYGLAVEIITERLTADMPRDRVGPLASGLLAEAQLMELPDAVVRSLRGIAQAP